MSSKSHIEQELESLREKAVARNVRDKYSGSGSFLSPEEAMAFLAKQRKLQEQPIAPPSTLTSSSELSDWYMQQRQREIDDRRKREEAEAYIRSYKSQFVSSISKSPSSDVISPAQSQDDDKNIVSPLSSMEDEGMVVGDDVTLTSLLPPKDLSHDSESDTLLSSGSQESLSKENQNASESSTGESHNANSGASSLIVSHQVTTKELQIEDVEVVISGTNLTEENVQFSPRGNDEDIKPTSSKSRSSTAPNYHTVSPTLPFSLADLSDWYMIQRQRELEDRKKREEAEAYLHSYRPQWLQTNSKERKPPTVPESKTSNNTSDSDRNESTSTDSNRTGDGPRLSPVFRMVAQFLQEHFKDDERNNIFLPSLTETDYLCHNNTINEPHHEVLSDMHNRFELLLAHGSHVCHQLALSLCLKGLTGSISLMYHSKPTNEIIAKQLNEDEMISPFDELSCNSSGSTMNILPLPSLWDRKERKMLSSDPIIILQKINSDFNEIALYPQLDLYPSKNREVIDEITQKIIYEGVYDGAIACGEAKNQAEYDVALDKWTESFDQVHNLLQTRRYIGDTDNITLADIALFAILIRVELVFSTLFLTNNRSISTYPLLLNYLREIFQMPHVEETIDINAIKSYYYMKYPHVTNHGIIPRGNNYFLSRLRQPHNRVGSLEYLMQAFELKTT